MSTLVNRIVVRCPLCKMKIKGEKIPPGHRVRCPGCSAVWDPTPQLRQGASGERDDLVGCQLGNYRIVRKIGQGGMGTVYEAIQGGLGRRIALKTLARKFVEDELFLRRFQREARAAASLDHPHIVQVYEMAHDRGLYFYSMQYVEGEDLLVRVQRDGPLPLAEALRILVEVIQALDYAYQRGVIHRDIKPDNILVCPDGAVKITDLGLARSLDEPVRLTATGTGLGSPHYMSPEQGRGDPDLDCRSDIYSLGITLFVVLTGMRPFTGKSPFEIVMAHLEQPFPSACRIRPGLPPGVDELLLRMTAKRREDRPASYDVLLREIGVLQGKNGPPGLVRQMSSRCRAAFRIFRRRLGVSRWART
ncbi:MAG: protein kinase [Planctomycetes bacterium]|nr:protein kinase [Planctomycetota bacterium]